MDKLAAITKGLAFIADDEGCTFTRGIFTRDKVLDPHAGSSLMRARQLLADTGRRVGHIFLAEGTDESILAELAPLMEIHSQDEYVKCGSVGRIFGMAIWLVSAQQAKDVGFKPNEFLLMCEGCHTVPDRFTLLRL